MKTFFRRFPAWLLIICGASLLLMIALALNMSPWLFGDMDWRWTYNPPAPLPVQVIWTGVILAGYIVLAGMLWRWANRRKGRTRWIVLFAIVAAIVIQIACMMVLDPDPLGELLFRTSFPYNAGFFTYASYRQGIIAEFLRTFPQLCNGYAPHPQRHPPGLIVTFMAAQRLLNAAPGFAAQIAAQLQRYRCDFLPFSNPSDVQLASALFGSLSPLITALGILPLYWATRTLTEEETAISVALISPLVPAYALWAGVWDQAFVIITGLVLLLLILALLKKRRWAWPMAGALLSVATFYSYAMLVLIVFAGVYSLLCIWHRRIYWLNHWRALLIDLVGFGMALTSVWIIYWLALGVTFLDVFWANLRPHFAMTSHYFYRLFYNPYDFILFLGFPLGMLMLASAWKLGAALVARKPWSDLECVVAAFLITFTMLVATGIARAEVGRVWIFLMPLAVLTALSAGNLGRSISQWSAVAAFLACQLLVLQTTLELVTPRPVYRIANPLPEITQVGAIVNPALKLEAFSFERKSLSPGDRLVGRFYWRTLTESPPACKVFLVAYPVQSQSGVSQVSYPIYSRMVSTCSQVGEVECDFIKGKLPQGMPSGAYDIILFVQTQENQVYQTSVAQPRNAGVYITTIDVAAK